MTILGIHDIIDIVYDKTAYPLKLAIKCQLIVIKHVTWKIHFGTQIVIYKAKITNFSIKRRKKP